MQDIDIDRNLADLARRFTRRNSEASVLKAEMMNDYPSLARLMEDSLRGADQRGTLMVPELRFDGNETVGVFSDYGGEHAGSRYHTYSTLVFGWNHAFPIKEQFGKVREKHSVSTSKEMAFKNLGHGPLARCLPDYLQTSDMIAGMLFTVAIHKDVKSVFGSGSNETSEYLVSTLRENGFGNRKPKVAEKLLRVVHITAYLTAWLSRENQKVLWLSDNDEIVPNEDRTEQTVKLFQNVLAMYSSHPFGFCGYTTPSQMDDDMWLADYLSVTDLAAGAVEYFLTNDDKPEKIVPKPHVESILNWLGRAGLGLKKHIMVIRPDGAGNLLNSELKIEAESPQNAKLVPISVKRSRY
ncbi:hypothetical protein [Pacificibacter marinus]|uniref:hypothetical protein n=1 Tax=Pacificibacter marinus TaxID=658057 RepID=UPI001C06CC80|nr:hypothetical protein [Pacificibacter marinus]MBU2865705.1 hypothetical protein [Pacificibacter marinus]